MSEEEFVEVAVEYVHHTQGAVKFEHGLGETWVPKSMILLQSDDQPVNGSEPDWENIETVQLPEWFANREGII